MAALILIAWALCALLTWALAVGFWDNKYPWANNWDILLCWSLVAILAGPIGVILTFWLSEWGHYGLKLWPEGDKL
jgi:uncharacterized membrane protein